MQYSEEMSEAYTDKEYSLTSHSENGDGGVESGRGAGPANFWIHGTAYEMGDLLTSLASSKTKYESAQQQSSDAAPLPDLR
ncbi:hypothetical protein SKAU_G00101260 [Synaphobranchus kaupii]|uniref:Uncharacterized protein n=1 Tax=Synaphobranchus kaupii TaxID=118154 RepID=A0A9Q1J7G8_SYNKA|nr:hypothetical protein SKAU_G00101260 [Synaphobranchus kaupii]